MERRRENYWQHSQTSSDGGFGSSGPSGTQHVSHDTNRIHARIIGLVGLTSSSGQVAYYWQQSQALRDGVWQDVPNGLACTDISAMSTTQQQTGYAWELNGKTTIPANSIVEVEYLNGQIDARGESWRILLSAGGETGIAVEELDGSPALTNRTTIIFDQADGFTVVSSGAAGARIDLLDATETQAGKVNTVAQTYRGVKSFENTIVVNSIKGAGGEGIIVWGSGTTNPTLATGTGVVVLGGSTNAIEATVYNKVFVCSSIGSGFGMVTIDGEGIINIKNTDGDGDITIGPPGAIGSVSGITDTIDLTTATEIYVACGIVTGWA